MMNYLKLIILLWRAPAEVKKKAEQEIVSKLSELPQDLQAKAKQARGTKHWKILLAAKVTSLLDNEELERVQRDLQSGPSSRGVLILGKKQLSEALFNLEWTNFVRWLMSQE
jgi:DUF917 family protein